jgi:hypothetical protein
LQDCAVVLKGSSSSLIIRCTGAANSSSSGVLPVPYRRYYVHLSRLLHHVSRRFHVSHVYLCSYMCLVDLPICLACPHVSSVPSEMLSMGSI